MTGTVGFSVPLCKNLCKEFEIGQTFDPAYRRGVKRCSVCSVWIPKEIAKNITKCPCCNFILRTRSHFRSTKKHVRY